MRPSHWYATRIRATDVKPPEPLALIGRKRVYVDAPGLQEALAAAGWTAEPLYEPMVHTPSGAFTWSKLAEMVVGQPPTKLQLIWTAGPMSPAWMWQISSRAGIIASLGPRVYVVGSSAENLAFVRQLPYVVAMISYPISVRIYRQLTDDPTLLMVDVIVSGTAVEAKVAKALGANRHTTHVCPRVLRTRLDAGTMDVLRREPDVVGIIPYFPAGLEDPSAPTVAGPTVSVPREMVGDRKGRFGRGIRVAVSDSGFDTGSRQSAHPDFHDRVVGLEAMPARPELIARFGAAIGATADTTGHGTHVAGLVLGSGRKASEIAPDSDARGMAPEAMLVFQGLGQPISETAGPLARKLLPGVPDDLKTLFAKAEAAEAYIHSNSWGSPSPRAQTAYDGKAKNVDYYCWEHPEMLVLFAAGNATPGQDQLHSPGCAKNCLTVGAVDQENAASFSCAGPAWPNRQKPELSAPGVAMLSTRSQAMTDIGDGLAQYYDRRSGTSFATPLVAGLAALVREHIGRPSSALLKAILVNGARSQGFAAPWDPRRGFGVPSLDQCLEPEGAEILWSDGGMVGTGELKRWSVSAARADRPLVVTLSWTDPVDRSFTGNLQNRLLLRVVTSAGSFVGDAGSNTQRVVIPNPGKRRINIEIEGLEVYVPSFGTTRTRQKFAWAAGNALKLKGL